MRVNTGTALFKAIILVGVALLLLIPLNLLRALVKERAAMRESAFSQVARGWGGQQMLGGPMLAIPVTIEDERGKATLYEWFVLPESLDVTAEVTVEEESRSVGIYAVPIYIAKLHTVSEFDVGRHIARLLESSPAAHVHLDRARLLLPLDDPRGLREVMITENEVTSGTLEPAAGFLTAALAAPVRADAALETGLRRISLTLQIAGTKSLSLLPLARTTHAEITGNWPHPGFTRGFLPGERHVAAKSFDASWQVLDLNRSFGGSWFGGEVDANELRASAFGVDLVQPVDLYQQAERAVKYGGLFISLSLLTLFLWEHLARRRMHPIQYGLMGLALSLFYLLLLALAEHIGFAPAYGVAAAALCALSGIYLAGAFRSRRAGFGAGGLFASVYGLLYLLVTSQDYALLTGAIALFGLLAAAMLLTRTLDWYSSGGGAAQTQ